MQTEPRTEERVDLETGELYTVALDTPQKPWRITSQDDLLWTLKLRFEHVQAIKALELRKKNLDAMIAQEQAQIKAWEFRFGSEVEQMTADLLAGEKKKSKLTEYGTVGFRLKPGKLEILDKQAALEWAKTHAPEAIKTDEYVVKEPLKDRRDLPACIQRVEPRNEFFIK